jgi:drug/metabolite transporter (DMT)-like permease
MSLAMIRVSIGFVFLFAITLLWDWRGLVALGVRDIMHLTVVGFLGVFSYAVSAYGLMHTSVTHYALIYSLLPSCTAMMSVLLGKERLNSIKLAGIVLSFLGCVVAVTGEAASIELRLHAGDLFVLLFTIMMSAHIVFSAGVVKRFGVMVSNTVMFGSSACFLFVASSQLAGTQHDDLSLIIVSGIVYVGFATAGVFLLRCRSLQSLPPATVGTFHNLIPIVTILLAYVAFEESIGVQTFIGATAVVAGAELVRRAHFPQWMHIAWFSKRGVPHAEAGKSSS